MQLNNEALKHSMRGRTAPARKRRVIFATRRGCWGVVKSVGTFGGSRCSVSGQVTSVRRSWLAGARRYIGEVPFYWPALVGGENPDADAGKALPACPLGISNGHGKWRRQRGPVTLARLWMASMHMAKGGDHARRMHIRRDSLEKRM